MRLSSPDCTDYTASFLANIGDGKFLLGTQICVGSHPTLITSSVLGFLLL